MWDFDLDNDSQSEGEEWNELYGTSAYLSFESEHRTGEGVIPHNGFDPAKLPQRKHEPFLNMRYPDKPDYADPFPVDFDAEVAYPRAMGGDRDSDGIPDRMTSLRDPDGAIVTLPMNQYGIMYCEGSFEGTGNIAVYGAMLYKAGFHSNGTPDLWFDESIYKGGWPPLGMDIPRVYVTQMETTQ